MNRTVRSDPEILARLAPSPTRRVLVLGLLGALGGLVLALAVLRPPAHPLSQVFLLVLGVGALWLAWRAWSATQRSLILTAAGLFDDEGRDVARLEAIARVALGAFAFKPSNGFMLHLRTPGPRAWQPGLWWRIGRFVGVGGSTNRAEARAMAEIISMLVAERSGDGPAPPRDGDEV